MIERDGDREFLSLRQCQFLQIATITLKWNIIFSGWLSYYEKNNNKKKQNIHTGEVKGIEAYKLAAAKFCL